MRDDPGQAWGTGLWVFFLYAGAFYALYRFFLT